MRTADKAFILLVGILTTIQVKGLTGLCHCNKGINNGAAVFGSSASIVYSRNESMAE